MYIYMYMFICIYIYTYTIYIYRKRARKRESESISQINSQQNLVRREFFAHRSHEAHQCVLIQISLVFVVQRLHAYKVSAFLKNT